jgi:hypothetical protein
MIAAMPASRVLRPPELDPTRAFPELGEFQRALVSRDWSSISGFFARFVTRGSGPNHATGPGSDAAGTAAADAGVTGAAVEPAGGPDDMSFAVRFAGEIEGTEDFLREQANVEALSTATPAAVPPTVPGTTPAGVSTLACTLYAARLIEIGWKVRTNYRTVHVSAEQFASFHDYLRHAERVLIDATAYHPENVAAWVLRMGTARGLELGQAEVRRRYDHAVRHDPHNLGAQNQLLQQLCPKWGGTFERMHEFARQAADVAPEGAPNAVLIAAGHLERWLEIVGQGGQAEAARYLGQSEVLQDVTDAAQRSALHPLFRRTYRYNYVHGVFAMCFSLAGYYDHAAVHFRAMGDTATEIPWGYLGDAASAFRYHRQTALGKG